MVCDLVLWCSACARKQGPWGPLPPFYCHRGGIAPPPPPSPLFCMMFKSINGGGSGGGEVLYAILKFLSQVLNR